jgi:uncharacterized protein
MRVVTVACVALLVGAAADAADPLPTQPSIAAELARLMVPEENWKQSIQGFAAQMKQFMEATDKRIGVKPAGDCPLQILEDTMGMFSYQELLDIETSALAKHYTDDELKDLLAFYRSPIGQKTIRVQPQLGMDVSGQMMAIMQARMPAIIEKAKARTDKCIARHRETRHRETVR